MCKMTWGREHDTREDMERLTGKTNYQWDDVRAALERAYRAYYTPCSAASPEGQNRIKKDTDAFFANSELPGYALSAAS